MVDKLMIWRDCCCFPCTSFASFYKNKTMWGRLQLIWYLLVWKALRFMNYLIIKTLYVFKTVHNKSAFRLNISSLYGHKRTSIHPSYSIINISFFLNKTELVSSRGKILTMQYAPQNKMTRDNHFKITMFFYFLGTIIKKNNLSISWL